MKQLIYLFVLVILLSLDFASADIITPFSQNNSLDVMGDEILVATHFSSPHMINKGYIFRFNPDTDSWRLLFTPIPILSISHSDSVLWIGTYGKGIFSYKSGKWEQFSVQSTGQGKDGQKDGLISNYVNTVLADKRKVYCATFGGLSIYDPVLNKWHSFDPENSALPTPYIFNLDKKNGKLWLVNSNYWYVYYEAAEAGNEKGSLISYDVSGNNWRSFTGTRKKLTSDTTFVELKGDIPSPNSNFGNVALDDSENVWFSFGGGVGVLRKQLWQIYNKSTCGIDFRWVSDIAIGNTDVWVACEKGLLQYNKTDDTWIVHEKGSDKIPGTVLTSIYVSNNSVWIKSYDPDYWAKQGLFQDPSRKDTHEVRGVNHRLNIDGNIVDIKCLNQEDWQKAYHLRYMEFLTLYKDNKWQSWELTTKLIDELTK